MRRTDLVYEPCSGAVPSEGRRGYVWDLARCGDEWGSVGRDGRLVRCSIADPLQPLESLQVGTGSSTAFATLPDRRLVVGDRHGELQRVDGQAVTSWATVGGAVLAIQPHADGVLVGDASGHVTAFGPDGQRRTKFAAPRDGAAPWIWAIAAQGGKIWVGDDSGVTHLHWTDEYRVVSRIETPAPVRALAVSPTGELAVGLDDGSVLRIGWHKRAFCDAIFEGAHHHRQPGLPRACLLWELGTGE